MILVLRGVNNCWLQLTDILMKEGTWRGSIARLISGYAQNVGRLGDVAVTNTLPDCFASCLWIKFYKHADWQVLRARVAMFVIKVRVEFHFRIIFARYSNPFKVLCDFNRWYFSALFQGIILDGFSGSIMMISLRVGNTQGAFLIDSR